MLCSPSGLASRDKVPQRKIVYDIFYLLDLRHDMSANILESNRKTDVVFYGITSSPQRVILEVKDLEPCVQIFNELTNL